MDKYIFFFGVNWLSNFFPCQIKYCDLVFSSSEQLFMYLKAKFFKDYKIADQILKAQTPKKAKKMGHQVKNFDNEQWDKVKEQIMFFVIKYKFDQNITLKNKLLNEEYNNKIFVEASPYDRIWGIGFSEENAIRNIDKWGQNLLGKIITKYRNDSI